MCCCLTASTARALLCMTEAEFGIQAKLEAVAACPEPEHCRLFLSVVWVMSTSYPQVKTILKAKQHSKCRHEFPRYNKAECTVRVSNATGTTRGVRVSVSFSACLLCRFQSNLAIFFFRVVFCCCCCCSVDQTSCMFSITSLPISDSTGTDSMDVQSLISTSQPSTYGSTSQQINQNRLINQLINQSTEQASEQAMIEESQQRCEQPVSQSPIPCFLASLLACFPNIIQVKLT